MQEVELLKEGVANIFVSNIKNIKGNTKSPVRVKFGYIHTFNVVFKFVNILPCIPKSHLPSNFGPPHFELCL